MSSRSTEDDTGFPQGATPPLKSWPKGLRGNRSRITSSAALLLALTLSLGAGACADFRRKINATQTALEHFSSFTDAAAERDKVLGLTDSRVFGRGNALLLIAVPAGADSANKVADSPETYEVVLPFWYSGKDQSGQAVRQRREMKVKVVANPDGSGWKVENRSIGEAKSVSFAAQAGYWLLNAFLAPMWLGGLAGLVTWSRKVLTIAALIAALPMAGYSGYVSFGSWWAVLGCLVVYLLIGAVARAVALAVWPQLRYWS